MLLGMMRLLSIKDLKDLSFPGRGDYRHAGPKGPEETFFTGALAGDRPPRYGPRRGLVTVGRGPVPRHAIGYTRDCGGQAPALRARKGFSSPCAIRDQASPNYSLLPLILLIVIIL